MSGSELDSIRRPDFKRRIDRAKRRAIGRLRVIRKSRKLAMARAEKIARRAKRRALVQVRVVRSKLPTEKRRLHASFLMRRIRWETSARVYATRAGEFALKISATLLSCIPAALVFFFEGQGGKASESHLTAAQIIGAALALVLSLSIIPAQRAAELLSMPILHLYAKDKALISVFLILVGTTAASVFLGSLAVDIPFRWAIALQFLLLGVSFDALRLFYSRVLDLLVPSTAIDIVVSTCERLIAQVSNVVEKFLKVQSVSGMSDEAQPVTRAVVFANSHVPRHLNFWTAQLEEFARRFVARKDTSAANHTIKGLERIGLNYLEARKKSILLHVDPNFPFSGGMSEISNVLNPIYESISSIVTDATAEKNERIVTRCVNSFGSMVEATTFATTEVHGSLTAPLAFGAAFYFDRCIQSAVNAQMPDAVLSGIADIERILKRCPENVDLTGAISKLRDCLFFVAGAGYARDDHLWTFPAVSAMLKSVNRELQANGDHHSVLEELLERMARLVPLEVAKDIAGQRRLETFPAYNSLGFDASLPFLLQSISQKIKPVESGKRLRSDPFADFVEAATEINHHFQRLAKIDLKNSLLRKWIVDTLIATVRVHYFLMVAPPTGTEGFIDEVKRSMTSMMSWLPRFFPETQPFQEHFAKEAADDIVLLGIEPLRRQWWDVVRACETTLKALAPAEVFGESKRYFVADIQQHIEILARAADGAGAKSIATSLRVPINRPSGMNDSSWQALLSALSNRRRHLEEEIAGYRGSRMRRRDPVATMLEFVKACQASASGTTSVPNSQRG